MSFRDHFLYLINAIPFSTYVLVLVSFFICVVFLFFKGREQYVKGLFLLLLIHYFIIIVCSTLIYRTAPSERAYNYFPLWSYSRTDLVVENQLNIIMFIPIGVFLGGALQNLKWWKIILIGCTMSCVIEIMQVIFKRGFSELDDVIHNTIGCAIGYVIIKVIKETRCWVKRKRICLL